MGSEPVARLRSPSLLQAPVSKRGISRSPSSSLAAAVLIPLSGMGFDFSVSSTGQSSQTVSSGQTANFTIKLATMSGSSGTFTFACSSLPANSACTFNPASEIRISKRHGQRDGTDRDRSFFNFCAENRFPARAPRLLFGAGGLHVVALRIQAPAAWCFLDARSCCWLHSASQAARAQAEAEAGTPPVSSNNNTPAGNLFGGCNSDRERAVA